MELEAPWEARHRKASVILCVGGDAQDVQDTESVGAGICCYHCLYTMGGIFFILQPWNTEML